MKTTSARATKSTLVKWLLDNPQVWEGYPKPTMPPGKLSHSQWIFNFMQTDGLFSPRSQCNPLTIADLVERARAAKRFQETGVEGVDL